MTNYERLVKSGKLASFLAGIKCSLGKEFIEDFQIDVPYEELTFNRISDWLQKEYKPTLKSCPFCGGDAEIINTQPYDFYVRCKICKACSGEFGIENVAIEKWNRRAICFGLDSQSDM